MISNKEQRMDKMTIKGKPLQHIVDSGTNFSASRFLTGQDTRTVWNKFLYAWDTIYAGYPFSILTGQGSAFVGKEWKEYCDQASIVLRSTGTESHKTLGQAEAYPSMLKNSTK